MAQIGHELPSKTRKVHPKALVPLSGSGIICLLLAKGISKQRGFTVEERDQVLNEEGQARRRFLKQAGTVAWASPLILTMMSRAAHAQVEVCGTKIGGPGTTACTVTLPCGSQTLGCQGVAAAAAGTDCVCVDGP